MAKQNNFFNLYLKVNDKEAKQTLNSVGSDLKTLRGYTRNLEEGTEKWHEANKKLAEVEKTYDGMKKKQRDFITETKTATEATEDQISAMQDFGENASQAFSSLMAGDLIGFQSALVGLKAGIMGATKAAWAFIATPIGAGIAALAAVGLAAREWFQYNEQAREANALTQQLTQLSGDAMDQARIRATALEKTFGSEFKDNLKVARNLVQAFGISYEEAFDTIEEGLVRGGAQSDEFMDSLKEYPKFFAQAGYTVQEFQRILNSGEALGMYSDKLPDAIKEFQLSVSEQTTASRDALENAFGKQFTDELFGNINNGSITSKEALELISGEAENIGLNAQQASQLTADLFRGAGEDAGGALLIFEAVNQALGDQTVQYTALQQHTKDLADAHADLEKAQSDALKSDKYAAFASQLEITWIRAKEDFYLFINGMMEGFVEADTAFRRFVFQSVQYVKDAFTIGKDADWEKLGQQFDEQQKKIEAAAAARRKEKDQTKEENNPEVLAKQEAEKKLREEREKAEAEAIKRREELAKQYAESEKQRLQEIENLEKEYEKRKQDRLANSALKEAELAQQRALKKAEALGAEQELLDQIRAEHQVKIDEERIKEEEEELLRMQEFEARKLELENELRMARAESEAEREEIQKEVDLEKAEMAHEKKLQQFEEEMERLKLNEEEKAAVIKSLEEAKQNVILGIQKKYTDKKIKDEQRLAAEKEKIWNDSLDAAISLAGAESKVGQMLLLTKQTMAAAEMAIQLGLFQSKMSLKTAEATGDIAAGTAKTASAAPFPANIPLVLGFLTQVGGIISTIKNISKAKNSVKKNGFAKGGYTDPFGMGYRDESGEEVAGVVHTGEYVIPKFVRQDPEVPNIIDYLENKRKRKLSGYNKGGDVEESPQTQTPAGGSSRTDQLLEMILEATAAKGDILFGYEAEQKRQEQEEKLRKIKDRSKIKKD